MNLDEFIEIEDINELIDLSDIYVRQKVLLEQDSNLLFLEVLSRLKTNSECIRRFERPCRLHRVSRSFLPQQERVRYLYMVDPNSKINKFYLQHNGPLIFIEKVEFDKITSLDAIDSTTKIIRSINFKMLASNILMVSDKLIIDLNKRVHLDGLIYFSCENIFSCVNFNGVRSQTKEFCDHIKELLLLNSNHMIVVFEHFFQLLVTDHQQKDVIIKQTFTFDDKTQCIKTTVPNDIVFTNLYLNSLESVKIVVLLNSKIQVYKFDNRNTQVSLICEISSVKWTFFGFREGFDGGKTKQIWRESIIIDEAFMINNEKSEQTSNEKAIRFVLMEEKKVESTEILNLNSEFNTNEAQLAIAYVKDESEQNKKDLFKYTVKLIEVSNNGTFCVNEIDESNLESSVDNYMAEGNIDVMAIMNDYYYLFKEQLELERFLNNKIYLKRQVYVNIYEWYLYVYDIEKKTSIKNRLNPFIDRFHFISKEQLIFAKSNQTLRIFKLNNENEIVDVCKIEENYINSFNILNDEIKFNDNKFIILDPENRLSLKEIDYLANEKKTENSAGINLMHSSLICVLDENHILIRNQNNEDSLEASIVDVTTHRMVKSLNISEFNEIFACNKNFLILLKWKERKLIVYKIVNRLGSYEFIQLFDNHVNDGIKSTTSANKCHFDDKGPNKFIITFYNTMHNHFQVKFMEQVEHEESLNELESIVELKQLSDIEVNPMKILCVVSALDNYLILFQWGGRCFHYVDIFSNEIKAKIQMDNQVDLNVHVIPNTNDFIIKDQKLLYYMQYDSRKNRVNKIKLKEFNTEQHYTTVINGYLIIWMRNDKHLEIHKIDKIRDSLKLIDSICFEECATKTAVSIDGKYFICETNDKKLFVYDLENLRQITSIRLNDTVESMMACKRHFSFKLKLNNYLITFEIIENFDT